MKPYPSKPRHGGWPLCSEIDPRSCFCVSAAHQSRVTVVLFVLEMEWLLSTGQDKKFTWHCSESGQQLGTYHTAAWVTGLQYPLLPLHVGYRELVSQTRQLSFLLNGVTQTYPSGKWWAIFGAVDCETMMIIFFFYIIIMTTQPVLRPHQVDGA